jgi:hypothetical protein
MGVPCEVLNMGIIGHNMWQNLVKLQRNAIYYAPDLVVLGLFEDDLKQSIPPRKVDARLPGRTTDRRKGLTDYSYLLNYLKNTIRILEYKYRYKRGAGYLRNIEERKKMWGPENKKNKHYKIMSGQANADAYDRFTASLKQFSSIAHNAGAKVIVVFIPDAVQINSPHMQAVNRKVAAACQKIGVPFVDVTPVFEKQPDIEPLYLFPLDAHTSPRGHQLIAKSIVNKILELDLIEVRDQQ